MSPSHRAELPPDQPPEQPVPPHTEGAAPGPVDNPDGSAPAPPEADELDVLVDRLAAQQAQDAADAPESAPEADGADSALLAEEMDTLLGTLDGQREAVARKAEGLDDGQASTHLVGSATTVTGIIRHLADTERYWFREVVGGAPATEVGYRWFEDDTVDAEWRLEAGASLSEALADYAQACEQSRAQIAGRDGAEELRSLREVRTVRWVVAHMLAETSRHLGHLDLITELLDGRTGV